MLRKKTPNSQILTVIFTKAKRKKQSGYWLADEWIITIWYTSNTIHLFEKLNPEVYSNKHGTEWHAVK